MQSIFRSFKSHYSIPFKRQYQPSLPIQHSTLLYYYLYFYSTTKVTKFQIPSMFTTKDIVSKIQGIIPEKLSEKWDNTGLLIEPSENSKISKILLTIDLTQNVIDEAIQNNIKFIIAYHPVIFEPLKKD